MTSWDPWDTRGVTQAQLDEIWDNGMLPEAHPLHGTMAAWSLDTGHISYPDEVPEHARGLFRDLLLGDATWSDAVATVTAVLEPTT